MSEISCNPVHKIPNSRDVTKSVTTAAAVDAATEVMPATAATTAKAGHHY